MRTLAVVLSLFAFPLSAQVWFDPPNPTSRTPIVAHVQASVPCLPNGTAVSIGNHVISITLKQVEPCTVPPPADGYLWTADLGVLAAGVYRVDVGQETPLIGVAEGSLAVADASAQFVVSPNVAVAGEPPVATGNQVTITGLNLPACSVGTCAAPLVTFGGSAAQIVEFGPPGKLIIRAPAHDPGTVDVVVSYAGSTYTATAAFNYFVFPEGTDTAFFESVLFPVVINGPGAFGSNWTTELTMRNENDYTFPVFSAAFDGICLSCPDIRPLAHSTAFAHATAPTGFLLNIPRQSAPRLFFGILVRDLSRQSEALGTEIPVVREKDFFDRPFILLNVPADSRYRVALRFYRTDGGVTLHYRIRPLSTDETLVDAFAFLAPSSPGSALTVAFIGDLLTTYPQLAGKGPLRIDIDGTSAQRASWAFISVTNNSTQNVTVISPQ